MMVWINTSVILITPSQNSLGNLVKRIATGDIYQLTSHSLPPSPAALQGQEFIDVFCFLSKTVGMKYKHYQALSIKY